MDVGILGGLAIGFLAIAGSVLLDGGELRAFLNLSAFLIIFGGTMGATMVTTSLQGMFRLPRLVKRALFPGVALKPDEVIATLVDFAQTARKEGVLALQDRMPAGGVDPFLVKGIIGTVMGLVHVLSRLGEGTDSLGRGIAVAFLATFYGIFSANVLFLPMSGNLKVKSEEETHMREVMMEGILGIQSGLNPHMLEQKLRSFFASKAL